MMKKNTNTKTRIASLGVRRGRHPVFSLHYLRLSFSRYFHRAHSDDCYHKGDFFGLVPADHRRTRVAAVALVFIALSLLCVGRRNGVFHPPSPTTNSSSLPGGRGGTSYGVITTTDYESESFCYNKGSLHQLALDMINFSSPPGSRSYNKLRHVLDLSSEFYIASFGGWAGIFAKNQEMMTRLLRGYGLHPIPTARQFQQHASPENITLVETVFTQSSCPLQHETCRNRPRIFIQTEQKIKWWFLFLCHESPNCVILEFSEYNLENAREQNKDFMDSFVLLPVMTQVPSRLSHFEPAVPKPLHNRSLDMVFLGTMTSRRKALTEGTASYLEAHPDRKVIVQLDKRWSTAGNSYPEAKVCLVAHSWEIVSGGEYHRVSEFAQFGCIPVMEHFADTIGIHVLERCAGAIFTNLTNLVPTAADVIAKIDQGLYNDRGNAIIDWWKTGIHWEEILPTVFGAPEGPN